MGQVSRYVSKCLEVVVLALIVNWDGFPGFVTFSDSWMTSLS